MGAEPGWAPGRMRMAALGLVLVALIALATAVRPIGATDAAWVDREDASATLASATLLAPTGLRCSPASGGLTGGVPLVWTAPTATATGIVPTYYRVVITSASGATTTTDTTTPGATSMTVSGGLLTVLGTYTVTVSGLTPGGTWVSAASTPITVTVLSIAFITSYQCSA